MFVAGVDGCHAGWIAFKVDLPSLATSLEVIDIPSSLTNRPSDLAFLAIDIPTEPLDFECIKLNISGNSSRVWFVKSGSPEALMG